MKIYLRIFILNFSRGWSNILVFFLNIFKSFFLSAHICILWDPCQPKIWIRFKFTKTQRLLEVFDTNHYYLCMHNFFLKGGDSLSWIYFLLMEKNCKVRQHHIHSARKLLLSARNALTPSSRDTAPSLWKQSSKATSAVFTFWDQLITDLVLGTNQRTLKTALTPECPLLWQPAASARTGKAWSSLG